MLLGRPSRIMITDERVNVMDDQRYCKKCGALLAEKEYEICNWCSGDHFCLGTSRHATDDRIEQHYDLRNIGTLPERGLMDPKLDEKTIRAAVAGEEWAVNSVVENYADEIDKLCTCVHISEDGTQTPYVNQEMRSEVVQEFITAIMEYPGGSPID